MGSDNRGGGGTIGDGPVGAWRPRASAPQTVIEYKDRWFSGHTPVPEGGDLSDEGSVHEV